MEYSTDVPRGDNTETLDPLCELLDFAQWGSSFTHRIGKGFTDSIKLVIDSTYPEKKALIELDKTE
jgi:hypothetical protein